MLNLRRKYWSGRHSVGPKRGFIPLHRESTFCENGMALLRGRPPSDCVFAKARAIEPLLLGYYSVEFFFRVNAKWISRRICFNEDEASIAQAYNVLRDTQSEPSPESPLVEVQEGDI